MWGPSPITIEWWGYVDEASKLDSALFSLGNGERDTEWVRTFNPYAEKGRFLVRAPHTTGRLEVEIAHSKLSIPLKEKFGGWNFFTIMHDMSSGPEVKLYINTHLVASTSHDGFLPSSLKGLSVCTWPFWSEVFHRGMIDELKIFNATRNEHELRYDMSVSLQGDVFRIGVQKDLFGYWDFDRAEVDEETGEKYIPDLSPQQNRLVFGGCVPCEDQYKGFMPYSEANGVFPPANESHADPSGRGYRVCLPSAKDNRSPQFKQSEVYGGYHCYGNNSRLSSHPSLVPSGAKLDGANFPQTVEHNARKLIHLNGSATFDNLFWFAIIRDVDRGRLQYSLDNGASFIDIVADQNHPLFLPAGVDKVYFLPEENGAGAPYTTFRYTSVSQVATTLGTTVQINVKCPRMTFLLQPFFRCSACPPGSVQSSPSLSTSCKVCPENTFRDESRSECEMCSKGVNFAKSGSSQCTPCPTERERNPNEVRFHHTYCEPTLRLSGGHSTVIHLPSPGGPYFIASLPRYGALYQAVAIDDAANGGTTGSPRAGKVRKGAPLSDSFYTASHPVSVWAESVVEVSSSVRPGAEMHLIGPNDVGAYGSSQLAWSPVQPALSELEWFTVSLSQPLFITDVTIFENLNPGSVIRIEVALNASSSGGNREEDSDVSSLSFRTIWEADAFQDGKGTGDRSEVFRFSPSVCPSIEPADLVRVTCNVFHVDGPVEVDAVRVVGYLSLPEQDRTWVSDPLRRLIYEGASLHSSGAQYIDTFSFRGRNCRGDEVITPLEVVSLNVVSEAVIGRLSFSLSLSLMVISAVGIITCVLVGVAVFHLRKLDVFRAASALFCLLIDSSIAVLFSLCLLSSFASGFPFMTGDICALKPFLFGFFFSVMFGSLLAKSWRVDRLFNNTDLRVSPLPDQLLITFVCIILALDLLPNLLWATIDPLHLTLQVDGTQQTYQCHSEYESFFLITHVVVKGSVLVLVCYLSFKIRDVPSLFNETKAIGFVVATNVCSLLIIVVATVTLNDNGGTSEGVTIVSLLFLGFVSLSLLLISKLLLALKSQDSGVENLSLQMAEEAAEMANREEEQDDEVVIGNGGGVALSTVRVRHIGLDPSRGVSPFPSPTSYASNRSTFFTNSPSPSPSNRESLMVAPVLSEESEV